MKTMNSMWMRHGIIISEAMYVIANNLTMTNQLTNSQLTTLQTKTNVLKKCMYFMCFTPVMLKSLL